MALLEILKYPDPRLRTVAQPVQAVTDETRKLIDNMFETMYAAPGIGLAATQVDVHERLLVLDVTEDRSAPMVFINPEIIESSGTISGDEGNCCMHTVRFTREFRQHLDCLLIILRFTQHFAINFNQRIRAKHW